jgi:DNA-binding PucR family transcriptional regulator
VHANTVRYRLGGIEKVTGYSLTDPHDAFTVHLALVSGRLTPPRGRPTTSANRG